MCVRQDMWLTVCPLVSFLFAFVGAAVRSHTCLRACMCVISVSPPLVMCVCESTLDALPSLFMAMRAYVSLFFACLWVYGVFRVSGVHLCIFIYAPAPHACCPSVKCTDQGTPTTIDTVESLISRGPNRSFSLDSGCLFIPAGGGWSPSWYHASPAYLIWVLAH